LLVEELDKHVGKPRTDEQRAYTRASTARWRKRHPEKANEWGRLHPGNTTRYLHRTGKVKPIMPNGNPGYDFLCARGCSRAIGVLQSISSEEGHRIARIGRRRVVLPLAPDLSQFMGQNIVLMMDRERCLVRRAGWDIGGAFV
jgi:hypothetical protein